VKVRLSEMRGSGETTPAHHTDSLAELVCSNSFRSDDEVSNAVGLLHAEMRALGSLIMAVADAHKVPAGSALAVDREGFAEGVTARLAEHPNVELVRERVDALPTSGATIVATGPLTAAKLAESIGAATGSDALAFFDAIAPIVHRDSIDMDVAWMAARWDKGGKDYINCPLDKEQYLAFHQGLLDGEKTEFREWEKDTPYFEGCMPIEVMADRGVDTLRFGPMKPVGLDDPRTGRWPHAVVQLRRTMRSAPCGTWSASRPSSNMPSRCACSNHTRAREGGFRPPRRPSSQHLHQLAAAARPDAAVEESAAHPLRRPDHRLRRLCRVGRRRPARGPLRRSRTARPADRAPPATTALGALIGHITGGAETTTYQPDERQFRFCFRRSRARLKKADRKAAYTSRARRCAAGMASGALAEEPALFDPCSCAGGPPPISRRSGASACTSAW
jgi:methylenetetrahydrofolate--tRNA-(uracil-5-)-methyltransferase